MHSQLGAVVPTVTRLPATLVVARARFQFVLPEKRIWQVRPQQLKLAAQLSKTGRIEEEGQQACPPYHR